MLNIILLLLFLFPVIANASVQVPRWQNNYPVTVCQPGDTDSKCAGGSGSGTVSAGTIGQEAVYTGTTAVGSGIITDNLTNVGIGSTSPRQKLEVTGTVRAISFIGDGSQLTGISGSGNTFTNSLINTAGTVNIYGDSSTNYFAAGSATAGYLLKPIQSVSTIGFPHASCVDASHNMYVGALSGSQTLKKYTNTSDLTAETDIALGFSGGVPQCVFDSTTGLIYAVTGDNTELDIVSVNPSTNAVTTVIHTTSAHCDGACTIATDNQGTFIYGVTYTNPAVAFKVALSGGTLTTLSLASMVNGHSSQAVHYAGGTELYVTGTNCYAAKINPASSMSLTSSLTVSSGSGNCTDDMAYKNTSSTDGNLYIGREGSGPGTIIDTSAWTQSAMTDSSNANSYGMWYVNGDLWNTSQSQVIEKWPLAATGSQPIIYPALPFLSEANELMYQDSKYFVTDFDNHHLEQINPSSPPTLSLTIPATQSIIGSNNSLTGQLNHIMGDGNTVTGYIGSTIIGQNMTIAGTGYQMSTIIGNNSAININAKSDGTTVFASGAASIASNGSFAGAQITGTNVQAPTAGFSSGSGNQFFFYSLAGDSDNQDFEADDENGDAYMRMDIPTGGGNLTFSLLDAGTPTITMDAHSGAITIEGGLLTIEGGGHLYVGGGPNTIDGGLSVGPFAGSADRVAPSQSIIIGNNVGIGTWKPDGALTIGSGSSTGRIMSITGSNQGSNGLIREGDIDNKDSNGNNTTSTFDIHNSSFTFTNLTYEDLGTASLCVGCGTPTLSKATIDGGLSLGAWPGSADRPAGSNSLVAANNVGIGTWITSQKLDVIGTVKALHFIGDSNGLTGTAASLTAGTVSTISGLITQGTNVTITGSGTSGSPYNISSSGGGAGSNYWNLSAGNIGISTSNNVGIGTTFTTTSALTIMSGNVGIGTWIPAAALDITGTSGNVFVSGNIGIGSSNPGAGIDVAQVGPISAIFPTNVGIGTTLPTGALDVVGTVRALSAGSCTALYKCVGGVDAGVIQTSACVLCPGGSCTQMNGCF